MLHKPVTKLSRSLGIPLTDKAARIMEVRSYRPGVHGRARHTPSEYGVRLREKQRLKAQYHVSERQLRRAFAEAARRSGPTGDNLVADLERRLDATVLRAGLARTVYQARQMVSHGHVEVDGRRLDVPSARVAVGQQVRIRAASRHLPVLEEVRSGASSAVPAYLSVDPVALTVEHLRPAQRAEVPVVCDVQLVVEFYAAR